MFVSGTHAGLGYQVKGKRYHGQRQDCENGDHDPKSWAQISELNRLSEKQAAYDKERDKKKYVYGYYYRHLSFLDGNILAYSAVYVQFTGGGSCCVVCETNKYPEGEDDHPRLRGRRGRLRPTTPSGCRDG